MKFCAFFTELQQHEQVIYYINAQFEITFELQSHKYRILRSPDLCSMQRGGRCQTIQETLLIKIIILWLVYNVILQYYLNIILQYCTIIAQYCVGHMTFKN